MSEFIGSQRHCEQAFGVGLLGELEIRCRTFTVLYFDWEMRDSVVLCAVRYSVALTFPLELLVCRGPFPASEGNIEDVCAFYR